MPNNTYKHVQSKLSTMVSTRAVKRILKSSLKDKGLTPDNVDVASMIKILKGPVFKEFQLILPRDGLKKNLSQLMSELKTPASSTKASNFANTKTEKDHGTKTSSGSIFTDTLSEFWFEEENYTDTDIRPEKKEEKKSLPVKDEHKAVVKNKPPAVLPPLNESQLEDIVMQFAQLEHVKLVAAVRQKGEVVVSRGSGIDLGVFSRVGLMGLKLLQRGGNLKSYYLSHSSGELFLLILGQDIIVVMGTSELNVGAVFANMSAIKEKL